MEITPAESRFASSKYAAIRDHVPASWHLQDDFRTRSYRRDTKTKKLKDVDIFVVIDPDGRQAGLRQQGPWAVLEELRKLLATELLRCGSRRLGCTVKFGADDEVASFNVIPAFKRKSGGYEIPDAERGGWIDTNPKIHHEQSIAKNAKCDGKFVPLVKMIKGINRNFGEPIQPPFLLEVMAHKLVDDRFGRYQDEATGSSPARLSKSPMTGQTRPRSGRWSTARCQRASASPPPGRCASGSASPRRGASGGRRQGARRIR